MKKYWSLGYFLPQKLPPTLSNVNESLWQPKSKNFKSLKKIYVFWVKFKLIVAEK